MATLPLKPKCQQMPKARKKRIRKKKQCAVCDKKVIHLKEHMLIHTGEKSFACTECAYKCARNSHLKEHMLIHTGVKDFACTECAYKCARNSDLKTHMLYHTGVKDFACTECTYRCVQKSNLNAHLASVHDIGDFPCTQCDKSFSFKGTLKQHMLYHAGVKDFACTECTYRCVQKGSLNTHLASVHDIGDCVCTLCKGNCSRLRPWVDPATNVLAQCCRKCYMQKTGKDIRIEHEWSLFLDEEFHSEFRRCANTQVNSCNTSRPDGLWVFPGLVLHWELDEKQHSGKNYSYEERRLTELHGQFSGNRYIVVRVNPHSYRAPGRLKPLQKDRKHLMLQVLQACLTKEWDTMIHIVYLCYSADNPNITQNISKTMLYDAQDVENFCRSVPSQNTRA